MAVDYVIYRNEREGTRPSAYCRVQQWQTLPVEKLCQEAAMALGMNAGMVQVVLQQVMDEAMRYALEGFRVELGKKRLSLYPQVRHAVRATVDEDTGEILWPTSDQMVPVRADGRLECEVHKSWNRDFRRKVHWERAKNDRREYRKR